MGKKGKVFAFEPDPDNYQRLIKLIKLNKSKNIIPSNKALWSKKEKLVFLNKSNMCSGIDFKNNHHINRNNSKRIEIMADSLDNQLSKLKINKVDFIKMDVEGAEMEAINGAENIIKEFKPRLAISLYHKPDDIWQIPIKLKSLNPNYEFYFGHHSPVRWESVLYAIQR